MITRKAIAITIFFPIYLWMYPQFLNLNTWFINNLFSVIISKLNGQKIKKLILLWQKYSIRPLRSLLNLIRLAFIRSKFSTRFQNINIVWSNKLLRHSFCIKILLKTQNHFLYVQFSIVLTSCISLEVSKNLFFHCLKPNDAVHDDGEEAKVYKR